MFGSSLHSVVCRRAHVLFLRYLCLLRIVVSNIYCVVFLFCFYSSCVSYVVSFSGLFILIAPSVFVFYLSQWSSVLPCTMSPVF